MFDFMIERRVFPPDVKGPFDIELGGSARLINHVKAIPKAQDSAALRILLVYTSVSQFLSVLRCPRTRAAQSWHLQAMFH